MDNHYGRTINDSAPGCLVRRARSEITNKSYPPYCADVTPEIDQLVERRWKEYGF